MSFLVFLQLILNKFSTFLNMLCKFSRRSFNVFFVDFKELFTHSVEVFSVDSYFYFARFSSLFFEPRFS